MIYSQTDLHIFIGIPLSLIIKSMFSISLRSISCNKKRQANSLASLSNEFFLFLIKTEKKYFHHNA